jgi:hypothetical protein
MDRPSLKYPLLGVAILVLALPMQSQLVPSRRPPRPCEESVDQANLPALFAVQNFVLGPSYSCDPSHQGYAVAALFLSGMSKQINDPELLFNGACGSPDYFDVFLNGGDRSLIADLGNTPLAAAATPMRGIFSFADTARFSSTANIVSGHTYAVLTNNSYARGLFVFAVTRFVPDQEVDLQYEVVEYQVVVAVDRASAG